MKRSRRRSRSRHIPPAVSTAIELLEDRRVLSGLPVSWVSAPDLGISFAPDGTDVAGHASNLHDVFSRVASTDEWQQAIYSAFSVWLPHIDADAHVRDDNGDPLGSPGASYGDSRFGEVRIAAIPSNDDFHAFSIPHDTFVTGTWSGDIVFNSNWRPTSLRDIYAVAVHEAGHVLGLEHGDDPASPMFEHGIPSSLEPTEADIESLKALYGSARVEGEPDRRQKERRDKANDQFETAETLNPNSGFKHGRYTLLGNISNPGDVDTYRLEGRSHRGAETDTTSIVVRSINRGSLVPTATLYQQNGQRVADQEVVQNGNGLFILRAKSINPRLRYYIQVRGAEQLPDTSGSYELTVVTHKDPVVGRVYVKGSLKEGKPESRHRLFLARPQLLNLALAVDRERISSDTVVSLTLHDQFGAVVATAATVPGDLRSLPSLLLRSGKYYLTIRAQSGSDLPNLGFQVVGSNTDHQNGPLPSDPTGDPAFPCEESAEYCYENGTVSSDPVNTEPEYGDDPPEMEAVEIPMPWSSWWFEGYAGRLRANPDHVFAVSGESILIDVLGNDDSASPIEIHSVTPPGLGSVEQTDNALAYATPSGATGTDSFDYEIGVPQRVLQPDDLQEADALGSAVDIYGNLAIVGSPYADGASSDEGAAYVYYRDGAVWRFAQELAPATRAEGDRFGTGVAVWANTIVVTSPRDDESSMNSGAVYVFEFDSTSAQFVQSQKLTAPDGTSRDLFGESVSLDGDTLVVGARMADAAISGAGAAYVFMKGSDPDFHFAQRIEGRGVVAEQFGSSVNVFRNQIVVGAPRDDHRGVESGSAYVFRRIDKTQPFEEFQRLHPSELRSGDRFGTSSAIDAEAILIGAPGHDGDFQNSGGVWVFGDGAEAFRAELQISGRFQGDQAGTAVAIDGQLAAFSSPTSDLEATNSGHATLLRRVDGVWHPDGEIRLDAPQAAARFGTALAISHQVLVGGTPNLDIAGAPSGAIVVEDTRRATASVTVEVGLALRAESVPSVPANLASLTSQQLSRHVTTAADLWQRPDLHTLVDIRVAALPGNLLGLTVGRRVYVDEDAAGHGWHAETDDSEVEGMDLLTVVAHEFGHVAGLADTFDVGQEDHLMFGFLMPGRRRLGN